MYANPNRLRSVGPTPRVDPRTPWSLGASGLLPGGDRLRAMEQLESRALGKPKESVTLDTEQSETERALRALTPEQRLELWRRRGVHLAD